ncbi:hypothetical protein EXIGLDRAFT_26341 [Exidia glandulosa HHB12029]|uniref:Uncharacterized protein n=1 Tax=Exidia glandulosa HHB12029 TaxID=1314781 RepID=A0A165R3K0_EXIGL|nr:hypothetical protein EXIGLDRAFT_26341 [Exidia glandulosa HHB12029]
MVRITHEERVERMEKHYERNTFLQSIGQNDYGPSIDWNAIRLQSSDDRPCIRLLRKFRAAGASDADIMDVTARMAANSAPEAKVAKLIRVGVLKDLGAAAYKRADYPAAISRYQDAMRLILGPNAILPSPKFYDENYIRIPKDHVEEFIDLLALASNIAQCLLKLDKPVEAIDWLQESEQILLCFRAVSQIVPEPSWKDYQLAFVEYWGLRHKTWVRGATYFTSLANTALAAVYANNVVIDVGNLGDGADQNPGLRDMMMAFDPFKYFEHRHPEPNLSVRDVTCSDIQVRGIWERQQYSTGSDKPRGRMWASTWIWRGSLYVFGGTSDSLSEGQGDARLKDLWYAPLRSPCSPSHIHQGASA